MTEGEIQEAEIRKIVDDPEEAERIIGMWGNYTGPMNEQEFCDQWVDNYDPPENLDEWPIDYWDNVAPDNT